MILRGVSIRLSMLQLGSLLRVSLMLLLLLLVGCGTTEAVKGIQGAPGPTGPPGLVFTGPYSAKTSYSATELATFQGPLMLPSGRASMLPL